MVTEVYLKENGKWKMGSLVPIPGTTQMAHMLENTQADKVKFKADELKQFNQELAAISIKGTRLLFRLIQM